MKNKIRQDVLNEIHSALKDKQQLSVIETAWKSGIESKNLHKEDSIEETLHEIIQIVHNLIKEKSPLSKKEDQVFKELNQMVSIGQTNSVFGGSMDQLEHFLENMALLNFEEKLEFDLSIKGQTLFQYLEYTLNFIRKEIQNKMTKNNRMQDAFLLIDDQRHFLLTDSEGTIQVSDEQLMAAGFVGSNINSIFNDDADIWAELVEHQTTQQKIYHIKSKAYQVSANLSFHKATGELEGGNFYLTPV